MGERERRGWWGARREKRREDKVVREMGKSTRKGKDRNR